MDRVASMVKDGLAARQVAVAMKMAKVEIGRMACFILLIYGCGRILNQ
jgi:hypothetical protein